MPKKARIEYEAGKPMSLEDAKQAKQGQILYSRYSKNADGTPRRWKVTSVKTWKLHPELVEVRIQHGLHDHARLHQGILHELSTTYSEIPCK